MATGIPSSESLAQAPTWEEWREGDTLAAEAGPARRAAARLIGTLDAGLRRLHRVCEFTQDRECMLRLGRGVSRSGVLLSDGTYIRAGESVGILHLWNERLLPFAPQGPDLIWAKRVTRRVHHSLSRLAHHLETDPAWLDVRALYANAPLSGRRRRWRAASAFGFDLVAIDGSIAQSLSDLADSFVAFALTLAFNPAALPRQAFLRHRHQLWISRQVLLRRYYNDTDRPDG
ncbi:MAG: hypothetical protein JO273_07090 [Methylobacteriaceae bacterium]|nr:hypothetical protein [Methylobacteriaceae bacterium]